MKTADYALIVSVGALATSITALGFQLWSALRLDRANLRVEVSAKSVFGTGTTLKIVEVSVTNEGKRPTRITSLWLVSTSGRWTHTRLWPKPFRKNIGLIMMTPNPLLPQPAIPGTLDVGEQMNLYYVASQVEAGIAGHKVRFFHGEANGATARGKSRNVRRDRVLAPDTQPPPQAR